MAVTGTDDMGLTEDPPTKSGSALQALPLDGGEGTQSLPVNTYLTKDGNQIGPLEKAVPCTSWFTHILQIRCQGCALWLVTGGVAWISKSLLSGEREQGHDEKSNNNINKKPTSCRTVRKISYNILLKIKCCRILQPYITH